MRFLAGLMTAVTLAVTAGRAQDIPRIYSRPQLPPPEVLDRLNLKMAWRVYIPMDGTQDGFATVQVLKDQMLVQTRSGLVVLLNSQTGETVWSSLVGLPYRAVQALGYNSDLVFVPRRTRLHAVDRRTGRQRWEKDFPSIPSTAPVAVEKEAYLCMGSERLVAYRIEEPPVPAPGAPPAAKDEKPKPTPSLPPVRIQTPEERLLTRAYEIDAPPSTVGLAITERPPPSPLRQTWEFRERTYVDQAPLVIREIVVIAGTDGTLAAAFRVNGLLHYRFQMGSAVTAPLGVYGEMGYVPTQDTNLHAVDLMGGRDLWRFPGGGLVVRKPDVTEQDVFVAFERVGLYRLDRASGNPVWRNDRADRFLAANPKFVYAVDRGGELLILDRARGSTLAKYNTRDYVVPISNEWTDRFYLAANDGLLVCLHDRQYPSPVVARKEDETKPPPPAKPGEKPPAEKDETKMEEK